MSFHVVAAGLPIRQPLYATLDGDDKLTWTDREFEASRFETLVDAEDFARCWIGSDGWKVMPK